MSNPLRQHISKQLAARQLQLVPANSNMCDLTVACLQFLGNLPVNKFWKSVYSCRSYDQKLHVVFLQKNVWPKCQCDKWHSHGCSHKFLARGQKQHRLFTMTQEWNQYINTSKLTHCESYSLMTPCRTIHSHPAWPPLSLYVPNVTTAHCCSTATTHSHPAWPLALYVLPATQLTVSKHWRHSHCQCYP